MGELQEHEHDFVRTFVRTTKSGQRMVIYAGERSDDEIVLICEDCGEEKPIEIK